MFLQVEGSDKLRLRLGFRKRFSVSLADELGAGALPLQGAGTPRGYWTSGGVLVTPLVSGASLARFVAVERMAAAITPQ